MNHIEEDEPAKKAKREWPDKLEEIQGSVAAGAGRREFPEEGSVRALRMLLTGTQLFV